MRETSEPRESAPSSSSREQSKPVGGSRLRESLDAQKPESSRSVASPEDALKPTAEHGVDGMAAAPAQEKGLRDSLRQLRERVEGTAQRMKEGAEGVSLSERPEVERELREGLDRVREGLQRWGPEDQARAQEWFGSSSPEVRERLGGVFEKIDTNVHRITIAPFESKISAAKRERLVAYVYPDHRLPDGGYRIHVGSLFENADSPPDSKSGIVVHEMSHFVDIADTEDDDDHYGQSGSRLLAMKDPERAQRTADNIEYFYEAYTPREPHRAG